MHMSPKPPQPEFRLTPYDIGPTALYALQSDTRLSYCLYVPKNYSQDDSQTYRLIVAVHGTERWATKYRDGFAEFAENHQAIVLAPLFPANLFFVGDLENYKLLRAGDIRFDLALLDMVDEISMRYRIEAEKFLMFGFSGGAHFAHRFLYTHPDRLLGVSIGAPGVVTLCDQDLKFPLGLKGMAEFLGGAIKIDQITNVPVHCVIGSEDTQTEGITVLEDEIYWTPGINDTGRTRIARLHSFAHWLRQMGCDVSFDLVPGEEHHPKQLVPATQKFFAKQLFALDAGGSDT